MSEQKQQKTEKRVTKVGTHGGTSSDFRPQRGLPYATGNPELNEKKQVPLATRDPAEHKARKLARQLKKDRQRMAAKALGLKLGRWDRNVAKVKNKPGLQVVVIGSPDVKKRLSGATELLMTGGAK